MKVIPYYRVSTERQSKSGREKKGLGLQAQRMAVTDYVARNNATIVKEYTEVESGRDSDRPQLAKAIAHAKLAKATILVAKLDRLTRNLHFYCQLNESGVEFLCVDNPHVTRLTGQILAAFAEEEARMIARRTKEGLAATKLSGTKLGAASPKAHFRSHPEDRGWKKGAKNSGILRSKKAGEIYSFILPRVQELFEKAQAEQKDRKNKVKATVANEQTRLKTQGLSSVEIRKRIQNLRRKLKVQTHYPIYETIADQINAEGEIRTAEGKPFTGTTVWRILKRAEKIAPKARAS